MAAGIFAKMPQLERTIIVDKRRYDLHWLHLWCRTVGTVWDLVVDLRGSAISFAIPARRRLVMRGGRRPGHRLGHLARVIGIEPPALPVAWFDAADRARAECLIPAGAPVIGLGPTANWVGKIWPAERFVALFRGLAEGRVGGARAAVFAGPGEAERRLAEPVSAALPGCIDLTGGLTLSEAAACLARCALFVGNDSGLMHLAAAVGTPTLGLFGPTRASEYAPAGRCTAIAEAPGPEGEAPIVGLSLPSVMHACVRLLDCAERARAA
jgi:ADP-heptose:LPS heptosyltransferase